ncbi:MAG TPA: ABC transporter permease [Steroidobacteraceae bacterium]|nr:ABC transporter permease [Steroidobacteraceae bacterium]
MMHAVRAVFAKEFLENLRERRTVISALVLGPLLGPLVFAAVMSSSTRIGMQESDQPVTVAVMHAQRAPNLLAFLKQYRVLSVAVSYDAAAARAAVQAHRQVLVLDIPPDFGAQLGAATPAPVVLYTDASNTSAASQVERVRGLIGRYGLELARLRLLARGLDPLVLSAVVVQEVDVSTPATRSVLALGMLSYLMLLAMLMGGMYLAIDATAGERERGSLEPLLTVPVPRWQLLLGKILCTCAYMALSLTITAIAFAIVVHFSGLERLGMSTDMPPAAVLRLILYCLPMAPLGAGLMTIVSASTRTVREAQTYLGVMLMVPTLPLVFAGIMGLRPTAPLMLVPSLSQHFLIMSVLREDALPGMYVLLSVAATLAAGALLCGIAGRLYYREKILG